MFEPDTRLPTNVVPAVNYGKRASHLPIDILLLHYTGMESGDAAIDWLCCEESGVSCHYVVSENGDIHQLVPEKERAWHAGQSSWQGERDTNSRSIGIEIVNPGHEHGYPDFPAVQIERVAALSADIIKRHAIPARNVLAHSDVAIGRKRDPGEKFPWRILHDAGVGVWVEENTDTSVFLVPGDNSEMVGAAQGMLITYGYDLHLDGEYGDSLSRAVAAFQRHFRPSHVSGLMDKGTFLTLERLLKKTLTV
ncbi:MAG: N-acetylmuramoyl-L-alanine amidase [Pseudomonadota bacterium]